MPTPADTEIFRTVVYALVVVIVAALAAFAIVGGIAFSKAQTGAGKSFGLLFIRGNFLRMATVVFCVFAVVVLAFAGKLTGGAGAVISGIAGFVLGGITKDGSAQSGSSNDDSNPALDLRFLRPPLKIVYLRRGCGLRNRCFLFC